MKIEEFHDVQKKHLQCTFRKSAQNSITQPTLHQSREGAPSTKAQSCMFPSALPHFPRNQSFIKPRSSSFLRSVCRRTIVRSYVGRDVQVVLVHGLRTPRDEIVFTAWPKIQSQSQIFRYSQSRFCLPHRPNFSDIFDLCLHWVSVVREKMYNFALSTVLI